MRIVVDTNIVFSALLSTNSYISQIILQPKTRLNFYSTERLIYEISSHRDKIISLTGYSNYDLDRMISLITSRIRFVNISLIPKEIYYDCELLTKDVDVDDCEFVALTEHIRGKLWSGDKRLIRGLQKKKWIKFVNTDDLYRMIMKHP
ncbi:MAG TPA: PIN domain-containing protein [Bacteroidales bacterium]|nr:PIN domain-containing protein [Bacteroidales bacterium]